METKRTSRRFCYEYPRPSVTVDAVVFGVDLRLHDPKLEVLLIERDGEPYKGHWALPGGFVNMKESLDKAVCRELKEEAGIKNVFFEQLYTFGDPDRDPRGRVISIAYYALVDLTKHRLKAGSDARRARWFDINHRSGTMGNGKYFIDLAFDHNKILDKAIERLQSKVKYAPIGFELLPVNFTLGQLRDLYKLILDLDEDEIDKANFRKKILSMGLLEEVGRESNVRHRPATMYSFNKPRYQQLLKSGFNFEL